MKEKEENSLIEAMKAWQDPVIGRAVGLLVPPSEKAIIAAVNETSQLGPEVMATSPTSNHYQLATDVGRIEPSRPTTPFLHPQIDISAKGCHEGEDNRSSSLYARFYFILSIFYFYFFFFWNLNCWWIITWHHHDEAADAFCAMSWIDQQRRIRPLICPFERLNQKKNGNFLENGQHF